MIYVSMQPDYICIKGHAHEGDGEPTKDEIRACSAVTTAAQQLLYSLQDINDPIEYEIGFGFMEIKIHKLSHEGSVLLSSFFMMMDLLEQTFTELITINRPDMEDDIKAIGCNEKQTLNRNMETNH